MKCFGCGQEGLIIKMCPDRAGPAPPSAKQQPAAAKQVGSQPGEAGAAEDPAAAAEEPAAAAVGEPAVVVDEPAAEEQAEGTVEVSGVESVKMSVGVGMDESTVLCGDGVNGGGDGVNGGGDGINGDGDGVNGGEGESEVRERNGVQGEQQVKVRGDEEHLGCGDQGGKGEVQVEEQNDAELVFGTGVAGETSETEEAMELEASAPLKRRSKRRNVVTAVQASKQACKLAAERKEVSDSSDNERFSDNSEISVW
ncbi:uncharacterized protein LOC106527832 [Austrofundulus limnaeus]|uniref:Uncharacterized protein LOC106527832 n=1 Tax=Austrofundulus limnaeus TaxID=52670 RepID=A0A2I4CE63_AUSLI|nr:PREDICTED: uncharacterized protein LOC106527832 [Austrofundulus limnaeus]